MVGAVVVAVGVVLVALMERTFLRAKHGLGFRTGGDSQRERRGFARAGCGALPSLSERHGTGRCGSERDGSSVGTSSAIWSIESTATEALQPVLAVRAAASACKCGVYGEDIYLALEIDELSYPQCYRIGSGWRFGVHIVNRGAPGLQSMVRARLDNVQVSDRR